MCMSIGFYNLAILIAFSDDLYDIDSNLFLVAKLQFQFQFQFHMLNSLHTISH